MRQVYAPLTTFAPPMTELSAASGSAGEIKLWHKSKTAFHYVASAVWRRKRMLRDIGLATLVINLIAL